MKTLGYGYKYFNNYENRDEINKIPNNLLWTGMPDFFPTQLMFLLSKNTEKVFYVSFFDLINVISHRTEYLKGCTITLARLN